MRIGYEVIDRKNQDNIKEKTLLEELDVEKLFLDKSTDKLMYNSNLKRMLLDYVRRGDIIVVRRISFLAKNTRDFINLIIELHEKGVFFVSLRENIDTSTEDGCYLFKIVEYLRELDTNFMVLGQREGYNKAIQEGRSVGRPSIVIDNALFEALYTEWKNGNITAVAFREKLNVKPNTFYRLVAKYEGRL